MCKDKLISRLESTLMHLRVLKVVDCFVLSRFFVVYFPLKALENGWPYFEQLHSSKHAFSTCIHVLNACLEEAGYISIAVDAEGAFSCGKSL